VNFPEWPSVISFSVVPVVIISARGLLSLAFYGRLPALVSARNAQGTRRVGQRGPGRSSAAVGSVANTNPSGDRACPFDPQGVIVLSGRRWRSDCLQPDSGCELVFPSRRLFGCGVFRCGIALDAGGVISASMELRESLEQVELEGRFVFHAVEPSLSDSRQDTEEIFTGASS
jgi:hypothetical protein